MSTLTCPVRGAMLERHVLTKPFRSSQMPASLSIGIHTSLTKIPLHWVKIIWHTTQGGKIRISTNRQTGGQAVRKTDLIESDRCRITARYISAILWRHGGLMVSALVFGSSGPDLSPGQGHCVVFLGKTLFLQCLSPPRCTNVTYELIAGGNPVID